MKFIRIVIILAFLGFTPLPSTGSDVKVPPREQICRGLVGHYACAKRIEGAWLAHLPYHISRLGTQLVLKLKEGRTVSRKDTPGKFEGYFDSSGNPNVKYTFYEYVDDPGYYVIELHFYEGGGFEFINSETGASTIVYGLIEFSPDKERFTIIEVDEEYDVETQRIEVWTLSRLGIEKEWVYRLKGWPWVIAKWSDSSTVEIYNMKWADERGIHSPKVIALIKNRDGIWNLYRTQP